MKIMSGLDARFLASETATAHMHTMKVVVLDIANRDAALRLEDLPALIDQRIPLMPVLRRRVVPMPFGLGNPAIIDDPDFDIARHLRHRSAPEPGGPAELDAVIAEVASTPLPRDRPLWELTVVDGLEAGRVAFIMKLHHALADGMASVALLENAFVLEDADAVVEPFVPEAVPTRRQLLRASSRSAGRALRTLPEVVRRTRVGRREAHALRSDEAAAVPGPFSGPRSSFNVALSADRTFASVPLPMAKLLDVKSATGATLNDVFLSVAGGGIRRYLARLGTLPERGLVASVPMATRTDRHRLSGNHVDNLFLPLRTDLADPTERVAAIHDAAVAARRIRTAFGPELFEARSGLVPAAAHGALPRLWAATRLANRLRPPLNLIASCVRGPRRRFELADGSYVASLISVGPILEGIGLNITAWSYGDVMQVSVLGCAASLPEPRVLTEDLAAELADWAATQ